MPERNRRSARALVREEDVVHFLREGGIARVEIKIAEAKAKAKVPSESTPPTSEETRRSLHPRDCSELGGRGGRDGGGSGMCFIEINRLSAPSMK